MARRDSNLAYDFSLALQSLRDRHRSHISGRNATQLTMAALLVDAMTRGRANTSWSNQDIFDTLTMIRGIRVMLDVSEGELLAKARRRGISFQRLATALGLKSRQAAEQRLIKLELGSNQAENDYFEARRRARLADDSDWSNFMRWWGAGTIAATLEGIVDENCLGGATTT